MAAFNIVNVASIIEGMATALPSNTSRTALNTAPAAGHVFEIGSIVAANNTASAATVVLELYDGTNYRAFGPTISVPPYSAIVLVDKSIGLSLVDTGNQASGGLASAAHVTSGTASAITYTMTYKDMS